MDDSDFHPGHKALWSLSYWWSPHPEVVFCVCSPPGNVTSTPFSSCLEYSDHRMPLATRGCCHQIGAWHSRPFSLHFHTYIFNDNTILDFFFFLQRWHPATHGILWLTSFLLDNMSWYLSVTGPVADAYSFHCFMMFQAGHTVFHLSPSMHEHADYTPRGFALINHTATIRVFLHTCTWVFLQGKARSRAAGSQECIFKISVILIMPYCPMSYLYELPLTSSVSEYHFSPSWLLLNILKLFHVQ